MQSRLSLLTGVVLVVVVALGVSALVVGSSGSDRGGYLEVSLVESPPEGAVVIDASEANVLQLKEVRQAVKHPSDNVGVSDSDRLREIDAQLQKALPAGSQDSSVSGYYIRHDNRVVHIVFVEIL